MTRYRLQISPKAEKELAAIRVKKDLLRLQAAIYKLAKTPRPPGCANMVGAENQWRIRVGDWRVIYAVQDGALVVLVVTVAVRGGGLVELG